MIFARDARWYRATLPPSARDNGKERRCGDRMRRTPLQDAITALLRHLISAAKSATLALALMPAASIVPGHTAAIPSMPDGVAWGETSRALLETLGARATVLTRPIDFGDAYADVVLRDATLGGVAMTAFFQMDKRTGGLKRVQFERPRHAVNPPAYRAVVAALDTEYGPPAATCAAPAVLANGYQAAVERVWLRDGLTIRAIFRDTTIEAFEGCLRWWMTPPCGLTGQMLVRFAPSDSERPACPVAAGS